MNKIPLFCLLLLHGFAFSQNNRSDNTADPQNMKVITDREPGYVKGEYALYTLVREQLVFSEAAIVNNIKGEVMLSFDVMPDSTVKNVSILSGLGYGIDEAVKGILEKQKFIPAMQNGVLIRMNMVMSFPVHAH